MKEESMLAIIGTLVLLALIVSLYITYMTTYHRVLPGCCGDETCNAVLASRWERWGPTSVGVLGIVGYLGLMAGILFASLKKWHCFSLYAWSFMVIQSLIGIGFVMWLIILQWVVLHHFCVYCLTANLLGVSAFILVIIEAPVWKKIRYSLPKLGGLASVGLSSIIAIHILIVPNSMVVQAADEMDFEETSAQVFSGGNFQIAHKAPSRIVWLLNDTLKFDLYKVPVTGPRDAAYVILDLSDYNCPSCRGLAHKMQQYKEDYGIIFAVVHLPVLMNVDCNPTIKRTTPKFRDSCDYARYSLAVNKADPDKFETYNDYLMEGGWPPALKEARAKAEALVGADAFAVALSDPAIKQWMNDGMQLYQYVNGKSIPKIITRDSVISYSGGSKAAFKEMFDKALGLDQGE